MQKSNDEQTTRGERPKCFGDVDKCGHWHCIIHCEHLLDCLLLTQERLGVKPKELNAPTELTQELSTHIPSTKVAPDQTCRICGSRYASALEARRCEKDDFREQQIEKNLDIAKSAKQKYRRDLAVYRLYRYCNLSPEEISQDYGTVTTIKRIIGEVFGALCISDKACPFKDFFEKYHARAQN